ncbi:MAG TPA: hypothetical protein DIU30_02690 [Clostridiales bacterium]|jgi:hypothetical protein|nr:hypothetical protein [Clostridium sp.]CDE55720.1 unknown [Clostridium sp. CAG:269]HCQ55237.1 hypothetical protein [Clostridiales bacterium]
MNSKMVHDTEDKIAYNFFESVINLRESIAEALMKAEKVNSSINEQISSYGFELLDEKLPDLGVTLNNKLVEIYQQFKESKVKVFQSQDKNKKFVIGLVPMLVINSLIERAVDAYRNEMGLYLQEAEGLQEQKEKNKEKIKEKSFITVLIIAIRTVFNEELAKKFYFDEAEVEDLRTKLEDYKKATEDIYNYDFKTDIIDIIAEGLASQNLSLEVIEDILNSDVVDTLEKLGLSDQMPVLRQKINQIIKSQNDSKKTWELSDEEKERANDYDSRDEDIITVTLEEDYEK